MYWAYLLCLLLLCQSDLIVTLLLFQVFFLPRTVIEAFTCHQLFMCDQQIIDII